LVSVANKYLLDKIKEGKTSQVIFGSQSNDLEGLLSRGNSSSIKLFDVKVGKLKDLSKDYLLMKIHMNKTRALLRD